MNNVCPKAVILTGELCVCMCVEYAMNFLFNKFGLKIALN